jgi:uncharacterized protein
MRTIKFMAATACALLALPAAAQAHVLVIGNAPAGGEVRLDVRVPNEQDNATTTKLQVQLPKGFAEANVEPVPGWTFKVKKVKLDPPVKTDDGEITEGVGEIDWTADSQADGIPVGGFQDFGLEVLIPGKAGDKLTFKAIQTYSNGDVVRWIGPEGSDSPAPVVTVTAAQNEDGTPAATPTAASTPAPTATPAPAKSSSSNGLAIVALIVGALGVVLGAVGLTAARRARTAA